MKSTNHHILKRPASHAARSHRSLAAIMKAAAPPEACGPEMPVAPARGPVVIVAQVTMVPRGVSDWRASNGGFDGRAAMRARDMFDRMASAATRARQAPPFTPGQVQMARRYRDLVERHDAGGIKVSRLDAATSDGTGTDFMDAFLAEGNEIAAIRRRIGAGEALSVRRIRPSERGDRVSIADRVLVDQVCLAGCNLDQVLRRHGWQTNGRGRDALCAALGRALDRMIGYRG